MYFPNRNDGICYIGEFVGVFVSVLDTDGIHQIAINETDKPIL